MACEIMRSVEGCFGARMMGGGFGGCAIALCAPDRADAVIEAVRATYRAETAKLPQWAAVGGLDPTAFKAAPGAGAQLLKDGAIRAVTDIPQLWAETS